MSCARPPGRDRVSNPKSLANRTASPLRPSTILLTKMLLSEGVFCLPCDESDFGEAAVFGDAADFGDGTCWPEKGNSSSVGSQLGSADAVAAVAVAVAGPSTGSCCDWA